MYVYTYAYISSGMESPIRLRIPLSPSKHTHRHICVRTRQRLVKASEVWLMRKIASFVIPTIFVVWHMPVDTCYIGANMCIYIDMFIFICICIDICACIYLDKHTFNKQQMTYATSDCMNMRVCKYVLECV